MKKYRHSLFVILSILLIWELVSYLSIIPKFLLPSFSDVIIVMIQDWSILWEHLKTSLIESTIGLVISLLLGICFAFIMDSSSKLYQAIYPLIILSQTIPTIAIAPLLVLWFGYDMLPKIILITLVCFFPITISLLTGLQSIDKDYIYLFQSFKATKKQIIRHLKCPFILPHFFSGLKVSIAYAIVGAVIAEWLGGNSGLGVYMIRVRKSFAFDKMFAVILLTSLCSLLLVWIVSIIEKKILLKNGLTK